MSNDEALLEKGGAHFTKGNDEVRVDVGAPSIGLTKEELEKYRNDPFWKPVRFVLFALFWLAWLAMFAGAILIVVLSPKCVEKEQPSWWQTKVSYQINVPTFYDSNGDGVGDFKGVAEKLESLRKLGISAIHSSPVLQLDKDGSFVDVRNIVDHDDVDGRLGTKDEFKQLVQTAHDKDMKVIVDVPLTAVSKNHPWFVKKENVFVTRDKAGKAPAGFFETSDGKVYYGFPDKEHPVLDYSKASVKDKLKATLEWLLEAGVDGFNLHDTAHLAFNGDGTHNADKAVEALSEIKKNIDAFVNKTDELRGKDIALFSTDHGAISHEEGEKQLTFDESEAFAKLREVECTQGVAKCVHKTLTEELATHRPANKSILWRFTTEKTDSLSARFNSSSAQLLTFMQLTLPGAVSLYQGQEYGQKSKAGDKPHIQQWQPKDVPHHGFSTIQSEDLAFFSESNSVVDEDNFEFQYNDGSSALSTFKKLAKLRRREEVLILGDTLQDELQGDVIAFSRAKIESKAGEPLKTSGPVYVVALNFGKEEQTVAFERMIPKILPEGTNLANAEVVAQTPGVEAFRVRDKIDITQSRLTLPAHQGVLFKVTVA